MVADMARQGIGNDDRLFRERDEWMGRVLRCGERKIANVATIVSPSCRA